MNNNFNPIYYNVIDQIYHASWVSMKLVRFKLLKQSLDKLWPSGHPTKFIQVTGTSGKGSVCRYLEAGFSLRYISGSFNSPHLFDYKERFSIQGRSPFQYDIIEAWEEKIKPICLDLALKGENHVHTYHEINILIALLLFEKYQVQWAALEVGMGGRYDQTTALEVVASVITNVGRDHEKFLGKEQWQRALDKGGVCRIGKPTFTSVEDSESLKFIEAICHHLNSPCYHVSSHDVDKVERLLERKYSNNLPPDALVNAKHQLWNATLALTVVKHFISEVDSEEVIKRIVDVRFQGRLQKCEKGIYADIAHNPDKIAALVEEIKRKFPDKVKTFIIALSGERLPKEIFSPVLQIADRIIITAAPMWKGVPPDFIQQELEEINEKEVPIKVFSEPQEALSEAKASLGDESVIILTGSTYMIDQALNPDPYLRYINANYGWRTQN